MKYIRKTHDEWWVYVQYEKDFELECECKTEEDAKKIRDEYRKIVNVKKAIYKKVQVKNERKN